MPPLEPFPVLLSGNRPTGGLHLGHWTGTLRQCLERQEETRCTLLVADLHALTRSPERSRDVGKWTLEIVLGWLSLGFDPEKCTFALQSGIPEIPEFEVLLSMICSAAVLRRIPALKEALRDSGQNARLSLGQLAYPVLMASDMLLLGASEVSVGADQIPHVELARKLARRFNQTYGGTFREPELLLGPSPRLAGTDGARKMSKSLGNAIFLSDGPKEIERRVNSMVTDPKRIHPDVPGSVEANPVFAVHEALNPDRGEVEDLERRYRSGAVGDVEVKQALVRVLNAFLGPVRERRKAYEARRPEVEEWLRKGTLRARTGARERLNRALGAMGLFRTA